MTKEEAIKILKDCELNPCVPEDREAVDMAIKALEQSETVTEFADRCRECGAKYGKLRIKGDEAYKQEMTKSVMLLDLFTKNYCRYQNDYERFGDLKFRCDECPFQKENGACLVKSFKNKYAPDYRDFGSMGDL